MLRNCLIVLLFFFAKDLYSQKAHNCDLWDGYTRKYKNSKFDTIKIKAIYEEVNNNFYYAPYPDRDKETLFYKKLQDKYRLNLCLGFTLINCDTGYCYPFADKRKYDYKLFHRKNKKGEYEDWTLHKQIVELTIVRYNRVFPGTHELITIIHDIVPIEDNTVKNDK
ncbi:MAG: hypothetical protein Q8L07_11450 [Sediminibacterium sp.]|nr:hypothetical protein [Sediminibacterium sp.]